MATKRRKRNPVVAAREYARTYRVKLKAEHVPDKRAIGKALLHATIENVIARGKWGPLVLGAALAHLEAEGFARGVCEDRIRELTMRVREARDEPF